ncbi:hypothetical protein JW877_03620 [bacterium]|nr:hypothetical protein [bacterium]
MHKILVWIVVLFLISTIYARIPELVSFQGRLGDDAGEPLADGEYLLTFRLYDIALGGSSIWSEQQYISTVNGLFTVMLGSENPFGDEIDFGIPLWLSVQVGAEDELEPRYQLGASPYALTAINAEKAEQSNYADSSRTALESYSAVYADYADYADSAGFAYDALMAVYSDTAEHAFQALYAETSYFSDTTGVVSWNDIQGMPPGFADGIDDLGAGSLTAGDGLNIAGDVISINDSGVQWEHLNPAVRESITAAGSAEGLTQVHHSDEFVGTGELSYPLTLAEDGISVSKLNLSEITISDFSNDAGFITATDLSDDDPGNELITAMTWQDAPDRLLITEAGVVWEVFIDNEADNLGDNVLNDLNNVNAEPESEFGEVLQWNGSGWNAGSYGSGEPDKIAFWNEEFTLSSSPHLHWNDSSHRLGIGTSIPAAELHVDGDVLIEGDLEVTGSYPVDDDWLYSSGSGIEGDLYRFGSTYIMGDSTVLSQMPFAVNGSFNNTIADFSDWASGYVRVNITSGNNADAQLSFREGPDTKWSLGNDGSDTDKFKIRPGFGSFSGNEILTITQDGKMGVNTSSPAVAMDIYGIQDISSTSDGILNIGQSSGQHVSIDRNEIHGRNGNNPAALFINDFGGTIYLAQSMQVHYDNKVYFPYDIEVGVGTLYPEEALEVYRTGIDANIVITAAGGSNAGLIWETDAYSAGNGIHLDNSEGRLKLTTAGSDRLSFEQNGKIVAGNHEPTASAQLYAYSSDFDAGLYGESAGLYGVVGSGTAGSWDFYAAGPGANYGPFTGAHEVLLSPDTPPEIEAGMIMSLTGENRARSADNQKISISSTLAEVKLADRPNDPKVYGVFLFENKLGAAHWYQPRPGERFGAVNAIGEGRVWVSDINGEIQAGDYITSSGLPGYGQKQGDDLLHNYTVGKAAENVNWNSITETVSHNGRTFKVYLIAVVYTSG